MTAKLMTVALNQLRRSETNVRTSRHSEEDIAMLAASIKAHGVIHPLRARKADDDCYEVTAGGGRLAALQLLAERGEIEKDAPVTISRANGEDDVEVSLAENTHRKDLNPADAYFAFKTLQERGFTVDKIATRFGMSAFQVRRRLALGALAPEILQALRDEELTLEKASAFTVEPDHKRQLAAFESLPPYCGPYDIKRQLTQGEMSSSEAMAAFVGRDAYEAAGGEVREDLFGRAEGACYFQDAALVRKLALEKLNEAARARADELGLAWGEADASIYAPDEANPAPYSGRISPEQREPNKTEAAKIAKLEKACEKAQQAIEDYDVSTDGQEIDEDEYYAKIRELEAAQDAAVDALDAERDKLLYFPEEQAKHAGVTTRLSYQGEIIFSAGILKAEGVEALSSMNDDAGESEAGAEAGAPETAYSDAMVSDLRGLQQAAVQEAMTADPNKALAFFIATQRAWLKRLSMGYGEYRNESEATQRACERQDAAGKKIETASFAELMKMSRKDLLAITSVIMALKYADGLPSAEVVEAFSVDVSKDWTPGEGFFQRLSKAQLADLYDEPRADEDEARTPPAETAKKGEWVAAATRDFGRKGWLPAPIRPATDQ